MVGRVSDLRGVGKAGSNKLVRGKEVEGKVNLYKRTGLRAFKGFFADVLNPTKAQAKRQIIVNMFHMATSPEHPVSQPKSSMTAGQLNKALNIADARKMLQAEIFRPSSASVLKIPVERLDEAFFVRVDKLMNKMREEGKSEHQICKAVVNQGIIEKYLLDLKDNGVYETRDEEMRSHPIADSETTTLAGALDSRLKQKMVNQKI